VVESHRTRNARGFACVLRGQDTDSSDLDILFDPTPETTLMDAATIQEELQRLLGMSVDVLTPYAWTQPSPHRTTTFLGWSCTPCAIAARTVTNMS
jgi:predicted nucleotidyltransferase